MDGGVGVALIVVMVVIALAALAFAAATGRLGRRAPAETPAAPPTAPEPDRFRDRLRKLQQNGNWPELFRLLDRSLPEWIVSASLIEVARELAALDTDIGRARGAGVSAEVTGRLATQTETVSTDLWSLAERIVLAEQFGARGPREELELHDETLVRLLGGVREAREGLAELSLSDLAGASGLQLAEGRFRSLAATAREIHEWEREGVPW